MSDAVEEPSQPPEGDWRGRLEQIVEELQAALEIAISLQDEGLQVLLQQALEAARKKGLN